MKERKGGAVYTIDLATILQLLREFRRSGVLQAELPAGLPRLKQASQVVIELSQGEVASCFVKNARGQTLLTSQEALQGVSTAGVLNWVFQQAASSSQASTSSPQGQSPASTPPPPRSPVPRRLRYISTADSERWPLLHRQTFVLVNGKRNIEQIAATLAQPVFTIEGVLKDLRSIGAVELA